MNELQINIEKLEKAIKSPATPANLKAKLEAKLAELKGEADKLKAAEEKVAEVIAEEKPAAEKKLKEIKSTVKKTVKSAAMSLAEVLKHAPKSQTQGRSDKAILEDAKRPGLPPGKRTSANGNVYYENRPNHSDVRNTRPFLEKGGKAEEMKNGGRIIARTTSGKPIYAEKNPEEYKDFNDIDHYEAANAHNVESNRWRQLKNKNKEQEHTDRSWAHNDAGNKVNPEEQEQHHAHKQHLYAECHHDGKKSYVELAGFNKEEGKKALAEHYHIPEKDVMFISEAKLREHMPKGIYAHTKQDKGHYKYGGQVPVHFGMGHNINVFGYTTKNFDICYNASKIFSELTEKELPATDEKKIAAAARNLDDFFAKEKLAVEAGYCTEADLMSAVNYLLFAQAYLVNAKYTILLDFAPQHMLEISKRLEPETIIIEEVEEPVLEEVVQPIAENPPAEPVMQKGGATNRTGLKTKLPESIKTIKEAKVFLSELWENGESYHCEDDAHGNDWDGWNATYEQEEKLNKLMDEIYKLPGNEDYKKMAFDPCAYLLDLQDGKVKPVKALHEEGGVTFEDKENAIAKNLEGKPVPEKYRKTEGKVFTKKTARIAARKIAGKIRSKELLNQKPKP